MEKKYFGSDLTVADYEILTMSRIRSDMRTRESDILKTKWFDYRLIHPAKATYLFAATYTDAVKGVYAETKDKDTAASIKAFKPDDVFQSKDLLSFWTARQRFDAVGVRYGYGLNFMIRRYVHERHWHVFPRPNQLYSEEAILDLRDAWKTHCKAVLELPERPEFRVASSEAPANLAFQKWITERIRERSHFQMPLSRILQESMLSQSHAEKEFGKETVEKAVRMIV